MQHITLDDKFKNYSDINGTSRLKNINPKEV